jgi:hypothetical protein
VVLVPSDPRDVPRIIALSKATYRKMIQNLWWAAGYNIVAIPLAAGVLSIPGVVVGPCERGIHSSSDVGGPSSGFIVTGLSRILDGIGEVSIQPNRSRSTF